MSIDLGGPQDDGRTVRPAAGADWTTELESVWAEIALDGFCRASGIDPIEAFLLPLHQCHESSNPYAQHAWRVMPHSAAPAGVLHALPRDQAAAPHLWEEWFLGVNGVRHHVLTPLAHDDQEQVFNGALDDPDHPPEVLGRPWRYRVDDDLRPVLLRKRIRGV